jgi:hypothetical protein
MTRLIEVAAQSGISEPVGEVLRQNEPMLQKCRDLGFVIAADPSDRCRPDGRQEVREHRP